MSLSGVDVSLHIFTHLADSARTFRTVQQSYFSFTRTFDPLRRVPVSIWFDRTSDLENRSGYKINLENLFGSGNVYLADSLSDGYLQAIATSKTKYMFMLEHDWCFIRSRINLSLCEILAQFEEDDRLFHIRFNKRRNIPAGSDLWLRQETGSFIKYCFTPNVSNNPHLIHRERYSERALNHVIREEGSKGVEEHVSGRAGLEGAIIGAVGGLATVRHLDGRNRALRRIYRRYRHQRQLLSSELAYWRKRLEIF